MYHTFQAANQQRFRLIRYHTIQDA